MSFYSLFFILFSIFIILGAIFSIASKNIIYTLLFAILVFGGVGCQFALVGATYNAIVQFLVYVLVIPILTAVSIMLIKPLTNSKRLLKNKFWIFLGILFFTFILVEFVSLNNQFFDLVMICNTHINQYSNIESIAQSLLSNYSFTLIEFGICLIITVTGLCYYEK